MVIKMKRITIIVALLVLFTGCNKDIVKSGSTLNATYVSTKTSVNGLALEWSENDEIAIFDNNGKHRFTADYAGPKVTISSSDELSETGTYYGFFPYSQVSSFTGSAFAATLPVNQVIPAGMHLDPKATPLIGSCNAGDQTIPFTIAHSLVKFILPAHSTGITIDGDTVIAGDYTLTTGGVISASSTTDFKYASIVGSFNAGEEYYMACLPKPTGSRGLHILVHYDQTSSKITSQGVWYYNYLTSVAIDFPQNQITILDLTNASGVPLTPTGDYTKKGSYIFVSDEGNCFYARNKNGNDMKFEDLQATVYWTDDATLVTGTSGNTHTLKADVTHDTATNTYYAKLYVVNPQTGNNNTHTGNYYLTYSPTHNGAFLCVTDSDQATTFAGYLVSTNEHFFDN